MAASKLRSLAAFSACDISDVLFKLKVPGAGFLTDIAPIAPHGPYSEKLPQQPKLIAPASTILLVPKDEPNTTSKVYQGVKESNIPSGTHYVDNTKSDTVVVLSQPENQRCAILGGILARRMKMLGAKGIIAGGRVRDMSELRALDFPVFCHGTSTVGTALESKPWALEVPINVQGITINPGDIVFGDPLEGVVVVPQEKLDEVIDMLPEHTEAEGRVMEDIKNGRTVKDAFAEHRK